MDRKKELKEEYKKSRPDMGVYIIRLKEDKKCLIESTRNLRSGINRSKFMLDFGNYPNQELQETWNRLGKVAFDMEALETLEYSKDETKSDYREDLEVLKNLWEDRLKSEGMVFFR